MIGVSDASTSDFFALELGTLLFWAANALWAAVALHGLILRRNLVAAYFFAAIWVLTAGLYLSALAVAKVQLSLVDSFLLVCAVLTVLLAVLDSVSTIGAAFRHTKSRDGE